MSTIAKYLLLLVVASLPVVLMLVLPQQEAAPVQTGVPNSEVIRFAKHLILQSVRSPQTAIFPEDSEFVVQPMSGNQWRVKAHVDVDNAVGAKVRMPWAIQIRKDGDRWVLADREHVKSRLTEVVTENSAGKAVNKLAMMAFTINTRRNP